MVLEIQIYLHAVKYYFIYIVSSRWYALVLQVLLTWKTYKRPGGEIFASYRPLALVRLLHTRLAACSVD